MTHPIFAGIFIGGLLAAIMSTADSMLVIGVSTIVNDIYAKIYNTKATNEQLVFLSRVATVAFGVVAFFFALRGGTVLWLAWFGWSTLGLFAAPVTLGLWWKRVTREGAIASLASGFLTLLVWNPLELGQYIFQSFAAGVVAFTVMVVVSLLTKEPPQEIQEEIEKLHFDKSKTEKEALTMAQALPKQKLAELMTALNLNMHYLPIMLPK